MQQSKLSDPTLYAANAAPASQVDSPLNAIITDDAMRKYKRIFNFLWGIKRVEQALSTSWHRASGLAGIGTNRVLVTPFQTHDPVVISGHSRIHSPTPRR